MDEKGLRLWVRRRFSLFSWKKARVSFQSRLQQHPYESLRQSYLQGALQAQALVAQMQGMAWLQCEDGSLSRD